MPSNGITETNFIVIGSRRWRLILALVVASVGFKHVGSSGIKQPSALAFVSGRDSSLFQRSFPNVRTRRRVYGQNPINLPWTTERPVSSRLNIARNDNLVSGIAEISIGGSIGVLWSELAVLATGCGPTGLSDNLERLCYLIVIASSGAVAFCRIAFGQGPVRIAEDALGYLEGSTTVQVRVAEWLGVLAILGALLALGSQVYHGARMDGLSGIDIQMCKAVRELNR